MAMWHPGLVGAVPGSLYGLVLSTGAGAAGAAGTTGSAFFFTAVGLSAVVVDDFGDCDDFMSSMNTTIQKATTRTRVLMLFQFSGFSFLLSSEMLRSFYAFSARCSAHTIRTTRCRNRSMVRVRSEKYCHENDAW